MVRYHNYTIYTRHGATFDEFAWTWLGINLIQKGVPISSLLYATVPTIVIGSRIVQNENFLIPFWLLSLYLINKYLQTKKRWMINIASIISSLLILAKVPWLVVSLSLGMILFYKGRWRDALFVGVVAAIFFSLFVAYGLYFDKQLFISLFKLQVARYDISFDGLFSVFTHPFLVDKYYLDGWVIFGWVSIFFVSKDIKKHLFVLLPFISYFVLYVFAIPNEPAHGWYQYPFYPFLVTALALVLEERKKLSFLTLFFIFIVGLPLLQNVWQEVFGFSFIVYRAFILIATVPILYFIWKNKNDRIPQLFLFFFLAVFIIFNIFSVIVYIE